MVSEDILETVSASDIPVQLRERLEEERNQDVIRKKEKSEAHLYTFVNVSFGFCPYWDTSSGISGEAFLHFRSFTLQCCSSTAPRDTENKSIIIQLVVLGKIIYLTH